MPDPAGDSGHAALIIRLRDAAMSLRRSADAVSQHSRDLVLFDRPDVWEGGRATIFRDDLRLQYLALDGATVGVAAHLHEAARRIETRLTELQIDAARAELEN